MRARANAVCAMADREENIDVSEGIALRYQAAQFREIDLHYLLYISADDPDIFRYFC